MLQSIGCSIIQNICYAEKHPKMNYVSQLIRYARPCSTNEQFFRRAKLLTYNLLEQEYKETSIKIVFLQVIQSIERPCQEVLCFIQTHADLRFYTCSTIIFIPDFLFSVFHDQDSEQTAVATGRQGMRTLPGHLIPLLFLFGAPCLLRFEFVFCFIDF